MYLSNSFKLFCIMLFFAFVSCSSNDSQSMKAEKYLITSQQDALSEKWALYFFNHVKNRTGSAQIFKLEKGDILNSDPSVFQFQIEIAPDLKTDYCIEHKKNRVIIRSKTESTVIWLIYQLISRLSEEDPRINSSDIPPAALPFKAECKDFDFEYREPHLGQNIDYERSTLLGNNNIDTDWGLWGHQLSNLAEDFGEEEMFALIDGHRNHDQLCFSSKALFEQTSDYILNEYGDDKKKSYRFMISPSDNDLVCQCPDCLSEGNSDKNATPAVTAMLNKLSEKFKNHEFYTISYKTTKEAPELHLNKNAGVFISTIDLPKGIELSENQKNTQEFEEILDSWQKKTKKIYLWDYAANFDDYLSPIPLVIGVQKQLQYFKKLGIKGIFLNSAGYDYMPFADVNTFVISALMKDTSLSTEDLALKYFKKFYPASNQILSNYYLDQLKAFDAKNKPYNMYGSMRDNLLVYLDAEKLSNFYESLQTITPKLEGEEKSKVKKLLTALSYSRLQIAYTIPNKGFSGHPALQNNLSSNSVKSWLSQLKKHKQYKDMMLFKESEGEISKYIEEWENMMNTKIPKTTLSIKDIKITSPKDQGFESLDMLVDNIPGFASNYQQGWYMSSSKETDITINLASIKDPNRLEINFLQMTNRNIFAPIQIEVIIDTQRPRTIELKQPIIKNSKFQFTEPIPSDAKEIKLKIKKRPAAKSTIALDEISIV